MDNLPKNVAIPVVTTEPTQTLPASDLWYAEGLRFQCTGCGNCCSGVPGYVWLDDSDMVRIAGFLGLAVDAFTTQYVRRVKNDYSLIEKPNYDCVFLQRQDGQTRCSIYPVRPVQCRTWPFWNMNLKDVQSWTASAERCPGMCDSESPRHSLEEIEKRRIETGDL